MIDIKNIKLDFTKWLHLYEKNNPECLILHHALHNRYTIKQCHLDHIKRGMWGFGYHFYIGLDGTIYKGRNINWNGGHCKEKGMNNKSIGICIEGCYTDYKNMTMKEVPSKQMESLIELSKYLMQKYNIRKIYQHSNFADYKDCAGKYFPFSHYLSDCFSTKIENWKLNEIEKAQKIGYIDSFDHWAKKANEPIQTWAVMEMLNDVYEKLKK